MARTTWAESRTTLEPGGAWGKMPPNYGAGNAGVSNTWNIPPYDPDKNTISAEYWQEQGRATPGRFIANSLVSIPYTNAQRPGAGEY